ncbi:MAG TPA: alternative ribosome rescue aminoacyl-tRNA hydrolase ArfB [Gemmatimonadaceae bacterium]|nr:alternative ribosome rescue aminoacyl-tRNA hydrolase ArfB [Gemmatimonadaceae bacterium]
MTDETVDGVRVNESVVIPRDELLARASRAGGAGGQHVNTSSTRIEIVWNVGATRALTEEQRERVLQKLSSRLDGERNVRVVASDRRSQRQNREAAESRLADLVRAALVVPKKRKPTKPSRGAKQARLDSKKRTSEKKRERRWRGE